MFSRAPGLLACIMAPLLSTTVRAYDQQDESAYLTNFPALVSASHSELVNAPAGLLSSCVNQGKLSSFQDLIISNSTATVSSLQVQQECGVDANCIIPQNVKLIMESDLNVGALTVLGELEWKDSPYSNYYLCAGYILVDGPSSLFHVDLASDSGWIYIKNNGAKPANVNMLGERVLGTDNGGSMIVRGRNMARTWSLLQRNFGLGDDVMAMIHNVVEMGWKDGDRIAIAPTQHGSTGTGQAFTITAIIDDYTIQLSHNNTNPQTYEATFINGQSSSPPVLKSAEVVNLSRNIVITGDDFEHIPCDPAITSNEETSSMGCKCSATRTQCTIGLHAIHHGHHSQQGMESPPGTMVISSTRIEKCGQRGIEGKYCLHFHKVGDCPGCIFEDNAVEFGMHRGITVHGTHRSIVKGNVLWNIRGANVYVEDGNEMYNEISYNVAVCPNSLSDPILQGCSIPGTSTPGADAPNAAFYSKAATNDWTGNRAANTYNGMLLDAGTRGDANGKVCASDAALGRWVGNTMHGCSRFGLYTLGHGGNFPKHTDRSIATNGFNQDFDMCSGFDDTESVNPGSTDRGYPAAFYENVDYHNVFVGHYMAGDLQHRGHSSINNNNLIYWKETKNMADGCSSHFFDAYYSHGNMALPDQGSVIITKTKFGQNVHLESNHHCDVGVTGLLCMPQYIFDDVTWTSTSQNKWVSFQAGFNNDGGIFSLAPGRETSSTGFFPVGYTSLAGGTYSYLLSSPGPRKCIDSTASFSNRYDNGILCNAPLRSFKIYSRGLTEATAPMLKVEVWFNSLGLRGQIGPANAEQLVGFHIIGGPDSTNGKQGYAFPIMSGLEQSYKISLYDNTTAAASDIPSDWVIEFSDPVIGNRFGSDDEVFVNILGRSCGVKNDGLISSQHDRRFLWSGDHFIDGRAWGAHGACTESGDMLPVDCSAIVGGSVDDEGSIEASECPELCAASPCNPANSFCDCGSPSTCKCKPGFSGSDCLLDVCSSADCGVHGLCSSRYLGGEGNVQVENSTSCICEAGWFGPKCNVNPCQEGATAKTCSGNGKCFSFNGIDTECQCNPGFLGSECDVHNIAHGKPSSTSSELQPSTRAFDGNTGSRWESVHGVDDVWLQVDLGDVYNLDEVEILWEATAAKSYEIQTSNDGSSFTAVWAKTDGYSGIGTVVSDVRGSSARFVRMQAFERTLQYGYSIWEMRIYGTMGETSPPTPHPTYKFFTLSPTVSSAPSDAPVTLAPTIPRAELAKGKSSSASSGSSAAFRAFDGDMGSRWESVHGVNDVWIQVDLGAVYELSKVITHWEIAAAKSYKVQVSDDGVSFTTVWSKTNGVAGIGSVESIIESVSGRFVRLQCYERATIYGYSIWEMEVWGIDNGPSGPTASAPSRSPSTYPCDGVCIGTYPYGCSTNINGAVKYGCLPNGGCNYVQAGDEYPYPGFCTYKEISTPSSSPTSPSSSSPSISPTKNPTNIPSSSPSMSPTKNPTPSPSMLPTKNPTNDPTSGPSMSPTKNPTSIPSVSPTTNPTLNPTNNPTSNPTQNPTKNPTKNPTPSPSIPPTKNPTSSPSALPTKYPTSSPKVSPTMNPTLNVTNNPTSNPTQNPTKNPTIAPSSQPTAIPTASQQSVNKYICSKNEPLPESICTDGTPSDAECPVENANSGCGRGGKSCWWAECTVVANPPTTPSPIGTNPTPTTSPSILPTNAPMQCIQDGDPCPPEGSSGCCSGSCFKGREKLCAAAKTQIFNM